MPQQICDSFKRQGPTFTMGGTVAGDWEYNLSTLLSDMDNIIMDLEALRASNGCVTACKAARDALMLELSMPQKV